MSNSQSFNKESFSRIFDELKNQNITLIAVTKTVDTATTQQLIDSGVMHIGENRLQSAKEKFSYLKGKFSKHFIGRLQTNKVKEVVSLFDYIHSVDSIKLARKIDKECLKQNKKVKVFYQINVSGEESKTGFSIEEFQENWKILKSFKNFDLIGLMTMAPYSKDIEKTRNSFKILKQITDEYMLKHLSMGMSNDYKIALEEGSTFVRIGSLFFKDYL